MIKGFDSQIILRKVGAITMYFSDLFELGSNHSVFLITSFLSFQHDLLKSPVEQVSTVKFYVCTHTNTHIHVCVCVCVLTWANTLFKPVAYVAPNNQELTKRNRSYLWGEEKVKGGGWNETFSFYYKYLFFMFSFV